MDLMQDLDLKRFVEVPEPVGRAAALRLCVSGSDQIQQNEAFHRKLQGTAAFRLRLRDDGLFLMLVPDQRGNLVFSPNGVRAHHPLGDMLRSCGLEPPVAYQMRWEEALQCWVGRYEGAHTPPPVALGRKKGGRRRKQAV